MKIKKLLLTANAAKFYKEAERRLLLLEARRQKLGVRLLKDRYQIDDVFVLLHCDAKYKKIIMWGGALPHILFATAAGVITFTAYDYIKDTLYAWGSAEGTGSLSAGFDGTSYLRRLSIAGKNAFSTIEVSQNASYLGGLNAYELALFAEGNTVYGRQGVVAGALTTVPDIFLPQHSGAFGSLFGLPAYKSGESWNLYRGLLLYTLNPVNKSVQDSWYWVPSFFTVQPDDGYNLKPGWYYGFYPNSDYSSDASLTNLNVEFKGLVDAKYTGGQYTYGWCELVSEVDGAVKADLNFYFQANPLTVPANSTFYHETSTVTYGTSTITIGTDLSGFSKSLHLETLFDDPVVSMWAFRAWAEDIEAGAVGIAVSSGRGAKFYRFKGYTSLVYESSRYHSHSVSVDGSILAVFESEAGGIIDNVVVFDLFGEKAGKDYVGGGFTELRNSAKVVAAEAVTACLIPRRAEDFTPFELGYDLAGSTPSVFYGTDYTDHLPAMASMRFRKDGAGMTISKVTCTDGVHAEFTVSPDPCFASVVKVDDPHLGVPEDKLVSRWDQGGLWRGLVRGVFEGSGTSILFQGIGNGSSPWYGDITLSPTFASTGYEDGSIVFSGYSGELILGAGFDADGNADQDLAAVDCSVPAYKYTASSTCGQAAQHLVGVAELTIGGVSPTDVGATYSGGGGIQPYSYGFDSGSINSDGVITSISGCSAPGDPRWGTVTVTDRCGSTARLIVLLPGGVWTAVPCGPASSDTVTFYDSCISVPAWHTDQYRVGGRATCFVLSSVHSWTSSWGSPISARSACPDGAASCDMYSDPEWYSIFDWRTLNVSDWRCP
jgi:hypothetical protein